MTISDLHKMYSYLTAEERFRLVLAASSRGDLAETDRLSAAGKRIELRVQEHAPWALAFTELAMITFMELVEFASKHREAPLPSLFPSPFQSDAPEGDQAASRRSPKRLQARMLHGYFEVKRCGLIPSQPTIW